MWHKWTVYKRFARPHGIPGMDAKMFPVGYKMFAFDSRFTANNNSPFATLLFAENFHGAIDHCNDRWIFGFSGLKDLRDSGQAPGNILCSRGFTWCLGNQCTRCNGVFFVDFDVCLFGKVIEIQNLSIRIHQDNLGM